MSAFRIAVIQRFLPSRSRGGVGYFAHGLGNALIQRGHEVTLFSQDPAPEDALYKVITLPGARPVMGYPLSPFVFPFQVAKQDFSDFDVIHAQGDDHFIPRSTRPPIVRTMHGSALAEAVHNGWRRRSPKHFFAHLYFYGCELIADLRAESVIGVSRDTGRYYLRFHGAIPNGVDIEHFSPLSREKSKHPTVLFVGEMTSRKRGQMLLDIVNKKIRTLIPDVEIWLVCPEKVEGNGVKWFGAVDSDTLAQLYRKAWVFCLPSSYEGFGRPYVEALAAGTPVIATPNPGAREILDHGRYGLIVPDEQLGDALYTLLSRADLRQRYSDLGTERAKNYAWGRVTESYEQVYKTLLSKRHAKKSS